MPVNDAQPLYSVERRGRDFIGTCHRCGEPVAKTLAMVTAEERTRKHVKRCSAPTRYEPDPDAAWLEDYTLESHAGVHYGRCRHSECNKQYSHPEAEHCRRLIQAHVVAVHYQGRTDTRPIPVTYDELTIPF